MRRLILALLILFAPVSAAAQTLTVRDIISLTKAGLGEEVLLALIEVHRPVFPVDPDTLKSLQEAGVRPTVILAMVRSGREAPLPEPPVETEPVTTAAAPPPQVVVVEHEYREPGVREVVVPLAVPVYVPVRVHRPRHFDDHFDRVDRVDRHVDRVRRGEPVYWGFGGKLRPDAWTPIEERRVKPFDPPQKK